MKKILIIDDESIIRRALQRAFNSKGYETFVAADAFMGEGLWKEQDPDLVIIDVIMPNKTGPELIAEMKSYIADKNFKIVLISAYSGDYDTNLAKYKNIDLFIKKPFVNIFKVVEQMEGLLV